jgi:hypothetical protein
MTSGGKRRARSKSSKSMTEREFDNGYLSDFFAAEKNVTRAQAAWDEVKTRYSQDLSRLEKTSRV